MGRKIMIVTGSPRKNGNTNHVANWVAESARDAGAAVEVVDAAAIGYKTNGCIACMQCQQREEYGCVIDDEASAVIRRMPDMDALVVATPVYWHGPTAQIKMLMDRTFSLIKVHCDPFATALHGTELALIATAAGPLEAGLDLVEATYKHAAAHLGVDFESLLVSGAPHEPGGVDSNEDVRERARAMGLRLAGV